MKILSTFAYRGTLNDGVITPERHRYVLGMLGMFKSTPVRVVVQNLKYRKRSNNQNEYMWGIILPLISEHTGHSVEDLHDIFKTKFLKSKLMWRGTELVVVGSTTELSTVEFGEYLDKIIAEAGELSIEIPEADKDWYVKEEFDLPKK